MSNGTSEAAKSHLSERGFAEEELLAAGLLVESDRGGYDRFRGRLMFPIRDERGRVAGFGGRALASGSREGTDTSGAKYINTAQSPMFDKGSLLYALDRAKEAIRRERSVVVVEGYMDAIAAHQHGISNVVASMGTALTERQIRLLERLRSKVLLAMDADAAGIEATLRGLQEAAELGAVRAGLASAHPSEVPEQEFTRQVQEWSRDALKRATVNFFVVPLSGKDPDEMIRADRAAWDAAVASAEPFTDHIFATVARRKDLSQPSQRSELLRELLPVVRLIEEPVYRAHYVQRLARLAQVGEDVVGSELRRKRARSGRRDGEVTEPSPIVRAQREPREEFLLALLLRYPELRPEGAALSPELLVLAEHRAILAAWQEARDLESVRRELPEELQTHLERVLNRDIPYMEGSRLREALADCVRRIEFRRLSAAKQASTATLAERVADKDVGALVEEARVLWERHGATTPEEMASAEGVAEASELAMALVEDMETGRRLHGTPAESRPGDAVSEPPQDEDGP